MSTPPDHPLQPLSILMQTLKDRAANLPEGSYTTTLLRGGVAKIGAKIREEAEEMVEAADESGDEGRSHFVYETGDLLYHAMVMMAHRGVTLDEVAAELGRRHGVGGLVEKASRGGGPTVEATGIGGESR